MNGRREGEIARLQDGRKNHTVPHRCSAQVPTQMQCPGLGTYGELQE